MRNKRFVLDPNIYISYFISRNQNALATLVIRHKLELVICDELITEFSRVLGYPRLTKFKIDIKQAVKFVTTVGTATLWATQSNDISRRMKTTIILSPWLCKHLRVILPLVMTTFCLRRITWKGGLRS